MRCLYCGRQLAFFRRLTGGAEFCSDAHRAAYQEEYNRLALSRLLQTGNGGEEPPPAHLPPPSQKLQRRPASYLDLGDLTPPPPQAVTATYAISPLASARVQEHDAQRRAGFVPWRQHGMPGLNAPSPQLVPSLLPIESELGLSPAALGEPAIHQRAEHCVRIEVGPITAQLPSMRTTATVPGVDAPAPVVAAVETVPPAPVPVWASKVTVPVAAARTQVALILQPEMQQALPAVSPCLPERDAPASERRALPAARACTVAFESDTLAAEMGEWGEALAFRPVLEFADTVGTGYVAGMKLGREQIRFEPTPALAEPEPCVAEPEPAPEQPPQLEPEPLAEQVLPHEFIAAVQAIDAAPRDTPPAVSAEPAIGAEQPAAAASAEPPCAEPQQQPEPVQAEEKSPALHQLCAWMPIELTPVPSTARQRLMQTSHALGIAAAKPAAPDFAMVPLRPKYVLGRAPATRPAAVAPSVVAVEEPSAAAGAAADAAVALETIPVANSLEFLQDYDKKGRSAFSKLLGKIGLSCLLIAGVAGLGHAAAPGAPATIARIG